MRLTVDLPVEDVYADSDGNRGMLVRSFQRRIEGTREGRRRGRDAVHSVRIVRGWIDEYSA